MPRYAYKVQDNQGRTFEGSMDGANVDEVIDRLGAKDMVPLNVEELNFDGTRKNATFFDKFNEALVGMQKKVPFKDVVFFTRQLATMVDAGVPLAKALDQLGEQEKPVFKKIILQIAEDISMGSTFSDAVARHPGAFNDMYISVVRSGEVAGSLDKVLEEMATYMENIEAMRQKVKGAMRYPTFITGFIAIMVTGIMIWLVPIFQNLYASMGGTLPRSTRILIAISNLIRDNTLLVILGVIVLIVSTWLALMNNSVKRFVDHYILYFPVFGPILRKNIWAKFCRTMALLMESGTPILQGVEIAGAVVGNKIYAEALEAVHRKLTQGNMLSQSLRETNVFSTLVTQLTATGEEAGKVDDLLRKAAEFYEREIRIVVDSLAAILEPFLIIIIGGIVGAILIALYLPIFSLGKLMQAG